MKDYFARNLDYTGSTTGIFDISVPDSGSFASWNVFNQVMIPTPIFKNINGNDSQEGDKNDERG